MTNTIYIYGDSHANTFNRAKKLLESNLKDTVFKIRTVAAGRIQDEFVLKTLNEKLILNPALTVCMQKDRMYPYSMYETVTKKQENTKIFLLFGSGQPHRLLVSSNSIQKKFYEFYTSDETPEKYQVIPVLKDMLKDELHRMQTYFFQGLDLLKEQGFNNIGFLSSPPLHRDVNYLIEKRPGLKSIIAQEEIDPKYCFASDEQS